MNHHQQLQGTNFISEFPPSNASELFALQQQQLQLQQQLNLAAYGNIVNMPSILAGSGEIGADEEQEDDELPDDVEYDEDNSSTGDLSLQQQQQLFLLQSQQVQLQQQQQQMMAEQNNIQINDANYFLINNPHLFNSNTTTPDDTSPMIIQNPTMSQPIIMANNNKQVKF